MKKLAQFAMAVVFLFFNAACSKPSQSRSPSPPFSLAEIGEMSGLQRSVAPVVAQMEAIVLPSSIYERQTPDERDSFRTRLLRSSVVYAEAEVFTPGTLNAVLSDAPVGVKTNEEIRFCDNKWFEIGNRIQVATAWRLRSDGQRRLLILRKSDPEGRVKFVVNFDFDALCRSIQSEAILR